MDKTNEKDEALRYLDTALFNEMQNLTEDSKPYFLELKYLEDRLEVTKCKVEECSLPLIFRELLSSTTNRVVGRRPELSEYIWSSTGKNGK